MSNVSIPSRFARRILTHVISVYALNEYPLMLAVQGPPGYGKSFQVRTVLNQHGYAVFALSASTLSGSWEGDSVSAFRDLYERGSASSIPAVLVLEDFDLSVVGKRDDTRYTVNSQLLEGYLMNVADDISSAGFTQPRRVPVLLTGNDFTVVYPPLVRHGRMDIFTWDPTWEEREEMVASVLRRGGVTVDNARVRELCQGFADLSPASIAAAVTQCLGARAYEIACKLPSIDHAQIRRALDGHVNLQVQEVEEVLVSQFNQSTRPGRFLFGRRIS